jgi:hypothetical protein
MERGVKKNWYHEKREQRNKRNKDKNTGFFVQ